MNNYARKNNNKLKPYGIIYPKNANNDNDEDIKNI